MVANIMVHTHFSTTDDGSNYTARTSKDTHKPPKKWTGKKFSRDQVQEAVGR